MHIKTGLARASRAFEYDRKTFAVRPYRAGDEDVIRGICGDMGFLGNAIDPVFEDRELFADFLTRYYLKYEPQSCFVLVMRGEIKGYLLGSRFPIRHQAYSFLQNIVLAWRALKRYRHYNDASRRFIRWLFLNAWREVPAAPRRTPHFHINVLPEARSMATARVLIDAYLHYLHHWGAKRVYGQIVTFETRRDLKMFERYGFRVLNRSEITKYRSHHPYPVYLCTVMKDIEENYRLCVTRGHGNKWDGINLE